MKVAFHGERPSSEPVEASSTAATASSGTATAAATSTSATAGTAVTVTSNAATASGAARDDYVEDARLLNPELLEGQLVCAASITCGMALNRFITVCTNTADCLSTGDCSSGTHQQRQELTNIIVIPREQVQKLMGKIVTVKNFSVELE
eukprot:13757-Heterococcus_DN1.PRE.1